MLKGNNLDPASHPIQYPQKRKSKKQNMLFVFSFNITNQSIQQNACSGSLTRMCRFDKSNIGKISKLLLSARQPKGCRLRSQGKSFRSLETIVVFRDAKPGA